VGIERDGAAATILPPPHECDEPNAALSVGVSVNVALARVLADELRLAFVVGDHARHENAVRALVDLVTSGSRPRP